MPIFHRQEQKAGRTLKRSTATAFPKKTKDFSYQLISHRPKLNSTSLPLTLFHNQLLISDLPPNTKSTWARKKTPRPADTPLKRGIA
jgi:hypothetical protein